MEYVRLKDIGRIVTGNTPPTSKPEYYGDYMPFIKATDIPLGAKCTLYTEQSYSKLAAEKYKESLVPKGSTCVVTIGSIGKKMTYAHTDLFVNQAINAIVPKKSYDKEYVYYDVKYSVLPQLKKLDSGTTSGRENVSKSSFSSIRIPIIRDKNIQHRIASILSTYDSLIENNTKRIRLLEKMAENLYKEWFVRFRFPGHENVEMENGLPKGWKYFRIEELCGINKHTLKVAKAPKEILYLDTGSITCGKISELDSIPFVDAPSRARRLVKHNSIVYSTVRPSLQHYGILKEPPSNMVVSTGFAVLDCKYDISNIVYLALSHPSVYKYCSLIADCAVATYPSIKPKEIGKVSMALPSLEVAVEWNSKFECFYRAIQKLRKQNTILARQRDLLLPRLMSGKLEV